MLAVVPNRAATTTAGTERSAIGSSNAARPRRRRIRPSPYSCSRITLSRTPYGTRVRTAGTASSTRMPTRRSPARSTRSCARSIRRSSTSPATPTSLWRTRAPFIRTTGSRSSKPPRSPITSGWKTTGTTKPAAQAATRTPAGTRINANSWKSTRRPTPCPYTDSTSAADAPSAHRGSSSRRRERPPFATRTQAWPRAASRPSCWTAPK